MGETADYLNGLEDAGEFDGEFFMHEGDDCPDEPRCGVYDEEGKCTLCGSPFDGICGKSQR